MRQWFAVLRTRGPKWDHATPLRQQRLWDEHATFTDGLEAEGLIKLAGPLEGSLDVLLIVKGESAEALVRDTDDHGVDHAAARAAVTAPVAHIESVAAACTRLTISGDMVSCVISQPAPTFCIHVPV